MHWVEHRYSWSVSIDADEHSCLLVIAGPFSKWVDDRWVPSLIHVVPHVGRHSVRHRQASSTEARAFRLRCHLQGSTGGTSESVGCRTVLDCISRNPSASRTPTATPTLPAPVILPVETIASPLAPLLHSTAAEPWFLPRFVCSTIRLKQCQVQ